MKTEKHILIAFVLNFSFAIFEIVGGICTGSVAIISDAVHDIGDAIGIGSSYLFEKKSKRKPDDTYTYGYVRYSVLGSAITTLLLLAGSLMVIVNAVQRLVTPSEIDYNGMIGFAIVGVLVNACAALFTHGGESLNQRAVNLHMLEDVLGWAVVLVGAVVMRFTDLAFIDPLISVGVALFIMVSAAKNLKEIMDLFLIKTPRGIAIEEIKMHLLELDDVRDVHHFRVWSMDGYAHCATVHIVASGDTHRVKEGVRKKLTEHGICHVTLELETVGESYIEEELIESRNVAHHGHKH